MIVVFANKEINTRDVSKVLADVNGRFKVSAVKRKNGKTLRGCVKIVEIDKHGKQISEDDEDTEYVREKLEDTLGEEILEIDDNDDVRFR